MKVQFEGEPSEIIALFEHFQASKAALESSTALVAPPMAEAEEPIRSYPAVEAQIEPELKVVSAVSAAREPAETVIVREERPNRQAPLKDRIVQFLEGRSASAKTRDISSALNWHARAITPRLSELVLAGRVERIIRPDGNEFKMRGGPASLAPEVTETVSSASVIDEPTVAPVPKGAKRAPKKLSDGMAVKELIVEFLREKPRSTVSDIRFALGEQKSSTITSRLFYLCKDGIVQKIDRENQHAIYDLVKREEPISEPDASEVAASEPTMPVAQESARIDPEQIEYLRIMAALVTARDASYYDLERITKIPRGILSSRLLDMERMHLVERGGGRRSGPVSFNPKAPNASNEMPLPYNSLEEAIVECLKQYEGASPENVSMLLLKALPDVERKMKSMVGTKLTMRGSKYFART